MSRFSISVRSLTAPAVAILAGLSLAGCDTQVGRDFQQSTMMILGTDEQPVPIDPNAPPPRPAVECPSVSVRDGTQTHRVYARGHEGDPAYLVYQGSISKTARECAFLGEQAVTMKFGIAGRVILGPQGQPGSFQLPIRVALVRPGGEPGFSELYRVAVTVPAGATSAEFAYVGEGVTYQIPPDAIINNHVLYAGFDEQAR